MNVYLSVMAALATITATYSSAQSADNDTVHFYLLMIPESRIESLRQIELKQRAARQEEGAGALGAIGEAAGPAANVGQILQGILGGDLRPIFAGSTAFIPEGDFREGITEILQQTIAPGIQRILTEFNKNVQRHFNETSSTPRPNGPPYNNQFQSQQNFNNPYLQQQGPFQPQNNFNQFQPSNQQFGAGVGGGAVGGAGAGVGAGGTFSNHYNQNFQQNQLYQQQNYPNNQQLQQPNFSNNQISSTQFNSQNNFPPNYNQYQQQPTVNTNPNFNNQNFQNSIQNNRPSFGSQFQTNNSPPVSNLQHQFQPASQTLPNHISPNLLNNNNNQHVQQYIPRASSNEK